MSESDHRRGSERRPIALQVRLALDAREEFVDRYAINISSNGIFIRSREPRPVGARLKFELRLRSGEIIFAGEGTVRWRQVPDARGLGIAGMGLQFDQLTDESRKLLEEILQLRDDDRVPQAVEGASPAAWRPLEEFPAPVEGVPDYPDEPTGPPILTPKGPTTPEAVPVEIQTPKGTAPLARMQLVSKSVAIGIDFGWANIRVAAAQQDRAWPVVIGETGALPAVAAGKNGAWIVGDEAARALSEGASGIRGISQLLGRWPGSPALKSWLRRQLADVHVGQDGRAAVSLSKQIVPARALAEALIQRAKAATEERLKTVVKRAVLAVPSGWTDNQRRALREAAAACDLTVDQIVDAPLAATLACHGTRGQRRALTVHFGDGGIEAAIVEQAGHVFDLVSAVSDTNTGGADIDLALVETMLAQFERETGLLVPEDPIVFERTRLAAAQAKAALGEALEFDVVLDDLVDAGLSRAELRQRITRARLQQVSAPILDRAVDLIRSALAARGFGGAELDEILLFGGQAQMGVLGRRVSEKLGREPARSDHANDAVAMGAALIASSEQLGRYVLAGAVGASVGIGQQGGGVKRVVERNLPLPVERSYTAATTMDGQREIELHLFQGEQPKAFDNEYVGAVLIGSLSPMPKGEVRVSLTIGLTESGELTAKARDLASQRPLHVTLDRERRPDAAKKRLDVK